MRNILSFVSTCPIIRKNLASKRMVSESMEDMLEKKIERSASLVC